MLIVPSPRHRARLRRLWFAQGTLIGMILGAIAFQVPLFFILAFGVMLIGSTTIHNETPS